MHSEQFNYEEPLLFEKNRAHAIVIAKVNGHIQANRILDLREFPTISISKVGNFWKFAAVNRSIFINKFQISV